MGSATNDLGIKTAVSQREAVVLRRLAAGRRVIEVGSLLGYSTIQLARTAEHVDAIDPHDGYPYFSPAPTLPCFLANLQRFGVLHKVSPRVGLAQDWLPRLHQPALNTTSKTMTTSDTWARRRARLAKFKREGLTLTADSDHCKWHHWHANWCPACVTIKKQVREEQALEIAQMGRHHVDLRSPLAKCTRFP